MSDYIYKIIPDKPEIELFAYVFHQAIQYLQSIVQADDYRYFIYEKIRFIDCGDALDKMTCPQCHQMISTEWWQSAMEKAYRNDFKNLTIELPCCHQESTLNQLVYDQPCGFSQVEIDIINPVHEFNDEQLLQISKILTVNIRLIKAHY